LNVTRYKWTIEIEVCAAGVADGFDASECVKRNDGGPSALCDMGEAAKWFRFDEATVKVIAAPDPKDIRPEQGYDYLRRPAEDPDAVWQVAPFDGCETCNGDGWIARQHTADPCHDSDHPRCSASCCGDPIPQAGIVAEMTIGADQSASTLHAWCGLDCLAASADAFVWAATELTQDSGAQVFL